MLATQAVCFFTPLMDTIKELCEPNNYLIKRKKSNNTLHFFHWLIIVI